MRILLVAGSMAGMVAAQPAAAQLRPLVDPPASADAARAGVDIFLLNEGAAPVPAAGPAEIETIAKDGTRLRLIAAPDGEGDVAPGKFARVHYRLAAVAPAGTPPVDMAAAASPPALPAPVPVASRVESESASSRGASSAFFDRFRPFEPMYGAAGVDDAGIKFQLSFDFRALGRDDGPHLDFAYTQTVFWAIDRPSAPIRTTDYSPEVFVDVPLGANTIVGGGYHHVSNGGGPATSIDSNRIFARATHSFDLGGDWRLALTPQAWFYVGKMGIARDLDRYWGYTSLGASIGQRDGLKLAINARGNPGTGKGSAEAFLSYPLARIDASLPHIYLFGQVFTGYGEALSDYNRNATHARLGIAFTR